MGELLLIFLVAGPAAVGQLAFVYRYLRYSAWHKDEVGTALLVKSSALAFLVTIALLSEIGYLISPQVGAVFDLVEVVAYFLVTIAIYWQLIVLIRVQREERRRREHRVR